MKFVVLRSFTEWRSRPVRNLMSRLKKRIGYGARDFRGKWIFLKSKPSKTDFRRLGQ